MIVQAAAFTERILRFFFVVTLINASIFLQQFQLQVQLATAYLLSPASRPSSRCCTDRFSSLITLSSTATARLVQQFNSSPAILNNEALLNAIESTNKIGGEYVGYHPYDGRIIRLKVGQYGAYLQLGHGQGKSTHSLPVVIRQMRNVHVEGKKCLSEMLGLTFKEAVQCVCEDKEVGDLDGATIWVAIDRLGPYLSYNSNRIDLVATANYNVFHLDLETVKQLVLADQINSEQLPIINDLTDQKMYADEKLQTNDSFIASGKAGDRNTFKNGELDDSNRAAGIFGNSPSERHQTTAITDIAVWSAIHPPKLHYPIRSETIPLPELDLTMDLVVRIREAFDPYNASPATVQGMPAIDLSKLEEQVDALDNNLRVRLFQHIVKNVDDEVMRQNYAWDFAQANIRRVATAMIVMGHIKPKDELETAIGNADQSLLIEDRRSSFVLLDPKLAEKLQGCYLMRFDELGFFRSGKVACRPFKHRFREHQECAMWRELHPPLVRQQGALERPSLYDSFPSKLARCSPNAIGYFEQIEFYSGLSFAVDDPHESLCATGEGGIFIWEPSILEQIVLDKKLPGSLRENQLHFVAYLCELAYNLALSSRTNMSTSPGFEWPLGIFYNPKK